jgi:tRNA nucleotidyltransferase (CCA-adding enzyme)
MELISTHINADFDALGSMVAASKLYPDAVMAFSGAQERSIRNFLLQSAIYALDIRKLSKIELDDVTRLILVDIRQAGRIGKLSQLCGRRDVDIHVYDHHPPSNDDVRGSLEIIEDCGSTTAIMCRLLQERGLDISPEEATIMMLGIYEDTGNLTFSSTTEADFQAAAFLLGKGANMNVVADMAIKELNAEQVSVLNQLIENTYIKNFHGIDITFATATTGDYIDDFAVLVHKLKNMSNVNAMFAMANMDDRIYIVGRSRIQEVNAGAVLALLGGGGHATAASATVHDMTLTQTEQELQRILESSIVPAAVARDIMSAPVKAIDAASSLQDAGRMLTRYNINVLPVLDEKQRLVGLISRQIIEKARHHGLNKQPVSSYMTTDAPCVRPSTPLNRIQHHIIAANQRFLPVVDQRRRIVGAITRTDLMRALHLDDVLETNPFEQEPKQAATRTMARMLSERLPGHVLTLLNQIGAAADAMSCNAYAVGGFVRDVYMRVVTLDIDIVIEGDGVAFARLFAERHGYSVKVYKKFGTAVITVDEGLKVDIASARLEYYEKPAALPTVEWSSVKRDLYRRDFTINTLAVRLNRQHFGQLLDFFGARRDIKDRQIRVLHNLSFVEDPSRIFRAIRFEKRFNFQISKLTRSLIDNAVASDFLKNVSGKRIFSEVQLLLREEHVRSMMKRLNDFDLLKYIHPAVSYNPSVNRLMKNIESVMAWYDLLYLDKNCEKWFVYFLGMIDSLAAKEAEQLVQRFDIKRAHAAAIMVAKNSGMKVLLDISKNKKNGNAYIYRLLHDIPLEVSLYLMAKSGRLLTKKAFSAYFTQLQHARVHLTGKDLQNLGIAPGKRYRQILDSLQDAVLNARVSGREEELNFVRNNFLKDGAK